MKLEQPAWPRSMPPGVVQGLATLGPVGNKLPAPGTWGSAAGVIFFFICFTQFGIIEYAVTCAALAYFAVGVCGQAEVLMEVRDPKEVIFDEFVSVPVCFLGWHMIVGEQPRPLAVLGLLAAGFALFRVYDIAKPWVIDRLQSLPGGWGIVLDDTAAALATCATLHVAHAVYVLA